MVVVVKEPVPWLLMLNDMSRSEDIAYLEMRLDVLVCDGNAPDDLARAVHSRILILARRDLAQAFADGREVHVRSRQVPPACGPEPWIQRGEIFERQQSAPDGRACEGDVVVRPRRVANDLRARS